MSDKYNIRKKRLGDRKDGRLLRSLDPLYRFMPFIMKERNDATSYFKEKMEITAAEHYIHELRSEGYKGIGILHLFLTAYVRCVAQFPAVNRFISGQRVYARNKIEVIMTIKKKLSVDSGETEFKVVLEPTDGIREIYNKISVEIDKIKSDSGDNSTENTAAALIKIPRFLLRTAVRFLTWMDYHGWLPTSLVDASPFHGSLVVTDLGSIGINPVYHHLYNFGNVPLFLAFGAKRKEYELNADGTVSEKKYIEYTVSSDERICDGYYYAQAFRHLKHYLRNPHLLDSPPEHIAVDVD